MRHAIIAALLFATCMNAKADPAPAPDDGVNSMDFNSNGEAKVNGSPLQDTAAEKPLDVYADVVKVIDGPEGSTMLYLHPVEARRQGSDGATEKFSVGGEPRPFSPDPDWKMFDAEGAVTEDPHFALHVIMPYPLGTSASMFDANWNECNGPFSGNYMGLPCSRNRNLSDDYLAYLKKNFLPCANTSLKAVGLPAATSVHIRHDGTLADQRHNPYSLHAVGRAIDVMQVVTTGPTGSNTFDFTKTNTNRELSRSCAPAAGNNCKFFEALRTCWHKLQVARRCPGRNSGPIGTIGWEDREHIAHHLHMSYPYCPNNKGYYITKMHQPSK